MKILNRYTLREWLGAFVVAMLTNIGLLIIEDIYKSSGGFIQSNISIPQILWYYGWIIIRVLPIVIPVSFFLSLLFALGKLHRNNEILAMRMTGATIFKITAPLWKASVVLTLLGVGLNMSISSIATQYTQSFFERIKTISAKSNISFKNDKDHRVWFIGNLNKKDSSGENIIIYFYDENWNEIKRTFAKNASFRKNKWYFYDIIETTFDAETKYTVNMERFDEKVYDFSETPNLFFSLKKRIKYVSIPELKRILSFSNSRNGYTNYHLQYYRSIVSPLSCMLILFVTIPFATIGVRQNPMSGVAKACGMLFLFYIASNVFNAFGTHGTIPIIISVLIPYFLVVIFSCSLYKKCI